MIRMNKHEILRWDEPGASNHKMQYCRKCGVTCGTSIEIANIRRNLQYNGGRWSKCPDHAAQEEQWARRPLHHWHRPLARREELAKYVGVDRNGHDFEHNGNFAPTQYAEDEGYLRCRTCDLAVAWINRKQGTSKKCAGNKTHWERQRRFGRDLFDRWKNTDAGKDCNHKIFLDDMKNRWLCTRCRKIGGGYALMTKGNRECHAEDSQLTEAFLTPVKTACEVHMEGEHVT